jgi:hypothetical protein
VFLPPTLKQRFASVPMAFMLVPVPGASGAPSAALAFRIHPQQMSRVLNASRPGASGETYAIDEGGRMVTETRFPDEVVELGLVPPEAQGRTTGAVAYALVTGQHVFAGESGAEIIGHHIHQAPVPPGERLGRPIDPFLERLILDCLAKRPEERPKDAGAVIERIEEGWKGVPWTQRDARAWWETRAPAMLAARRAAEATASRGPKLEVDVASRMRSGSLPELSLEEEGRKTALRPPVGGAPERPRSG